MDIIANEIITIHNGILNTLKRSVSEAIKIGELINRQKQISGHGKFSEWEAALPFSQKTSWNYQQLFLHSSKLVNLTNLQEAYKTLDKLLIEEKQTEKNLKEKLINQRIKTNIIPSGWDESLEREYKKRLKEGLEREERINKAKEAMNKAKIEREKEEFEFEKEKADTEKIINDLKNLLGNPEREKLADQLKGGKSIFDAIDWYVSIQCNDNQKLEALHDIIKYCKRIANNYQAKSIKPNN